VGEIDPRRQEKSTSWERNTLVAESDKHVNDHTATSRITTKENGRRIAMLNDMKVGSDTIVETAWKGELGSQTVSRSEYTSLQFSSVTLHLVAMLVDRTKVVGAAMDVENDAVALVIGSGSIVVVLAHLNPLALQGNLRSSPLPPFLTSDSLYTYRAKLGFEEIG
jgi:hypothetical protein